MNKTSYKFILVFLVLLIFGLNYPFLDKALKNWLSDYEMGIAERVIDGDTIVVNDSSVRLLGINTPEKGELFYSEAKSFLENLTLNKLIRMEKGKEDLDLYGRKLRYIFEEGENVNLKLVEGGFANFYFPSGRDRYYSRFKEAWEKCMSEDKNLCKKSEDKCSECIFLRKLDVNNQRVIFGNKCSFSCELKGWSVKDEGRKKLVFPNIEIDKDLELIVGNGSNTESRIFWEEEDYVWTKTGDSLFLRDAEGNLVLWWSY
ncbi:MAG: thermonuclease family protein [Nanoarchaeota archaeon]